MIADDIVRADINHWTNALSRKPDSRYKGETTPISSSTWHVIYAAGKRREFVSSLRTGSSMCRTLII